MHSRPVAALTLIAFLLSPMAFAADSAESQKLIAEPNPFVLDPANHSMVGVYGPIPSVSNTAGAPTEAPEEIVLPTLPAPEPILSTENPLVVKATPDVPPGDFLVVAKVDLKPDDIKAAQIKELRDGFNDSIKGITAAQTIIADQIKRLGVIMKTNKDPKIAQQIIAQVNLLNTRRNELTDEMTKVRQMINALEKKVIAGKVDDKDVASFKLIRDNKLAELERVGMREAIFLKGGPIPAGERGKTLAGLTLPNKENIDGGNSKTIDKLVDLVKPAKLPVK